MVGDKIDWSTTKDNDHLFDDESENKYIFGTVPPSIMYLHDLQGMQLTNTFETHWNRLTLTD